MLKVCYWWRVYLSWILIYFFCKLFLFCDLMEVVNLIIVSYFDDLKMVLKGFKWCICKGVKWDFKKEQKCLEDKCKYLKVLIKYFDKDYVEVKKRWVFEIIFFIFDN